jgi:hypothetical protein
MEYKDDGAWVNKFQALRQQNQNKRTGRNVVTERPESPNQRLAQQGIVPPVPPGGMPAIRSFNTQALENAGQMMAMQAQQYGNMPDNDYAMPMIQPQQQMMQQPQVQQQQAPVRLKLGNPMFQKLKLNGFAEGGPVMLCRQSGQIPQGMEQQEFVIRGVRNCYVVPLNETRIDLQVINNSSHLWTQLVEVVNGFGQPYLVPQQALYRVSGQQGGNGPQVMSDSRMNNGNRQQPASSFGKNILFG